MFLRDFYDLCHTNSSTIFRGFVFCYAYNFSKQASTPFSVKVERECTGWGLESGLILSGKFLGCARGMNTMGAQNEFKGIWMQNQSFMFILFWVKTCAFCIMNELMMWLWYVYVRIWVNVWCDMCYMWINILYRIGIVMYDKLCLR